MKNQTWIKLTFALAVPLGLALTATADDATPGTLPPAAAKQGVTYAGDIKPILDNSCAKCHSGDRPKGRLKLDSLKARSKAARTARSSGRVTAPRVCWLKRSRI